MSYLKYSDKVIGFYCCEEKDKNGTPYKLYCYVVEDRTGKKTCNFTTDKEEYEEVFLNYLKKNGYNKNNVKNIWTDNLDKVNLFCKDDKEIFDRIKKTTKDEEMNYDEFKKAKEEYLNKKDKKSLVTKIKNKFTTIKENVKEKLSKMDSKTKRLAIRVGTVAGAVLLLVGGGKLLLNRSNSPTSTNSKLASTIDGKAANTLDDIDDLDNLDMEALEENKEEEEKEEEKETENTTNTSYSRSSGSNGSSSSSTRSSSSTHNSPSVGFTDNNILGFQNPNQTIDNSSQNTESNSNSNSNQSENIFEEEVPVSENTSTNDDNYSQVIETEVPDSQDENTNSQDEEYTEEIVIDASDDSAQDDNVPTDDNTPSEEIPADEKPNTDEPTNDDNTSDDNIDQDEDLTLDDIVLDEDKVGNEGSIDNDLSYEYEEEYQEMPDGLDEYIETELPNPESTASDGNYVTTEEDLNNQILEQPQEIEVIPVEQETNSQETPIYTEEITEPVIEESTPDTLPSQESTASDGNYVSNDTEQIVDQAVEAMANGEDVNLVYDANNGSLSIEENTNTSTNSEAMVK